MIAALDGKDNPFEHLLKSIRALLTAVPEPALREECHA
jgi:hypothetical protein